ncbi:hypothetical protein [Paenibacillus ginsengarvi]|uniref:DUF1868 domain-containing protein n=1 Tax=Paenibacillus ginsengarvi TaxID=400777 RepID=A0A3B0CCB4_9BACL|nr:hypothetical protein [Paenibacillus ginsengarvi]RKN83772.1 hypothetical protein D7M11_16380 [Paenibacillus ginsengarvi]
MTIVTNSKVHSFVPVWAPFKGFSLLFDNPGDSYSRLSGFAGLEKMDSRREESALAFYRKLNEITGQMERELIGDYLYCPLPPNSYHVTVWDGINDYNVGRLNEEERAEACRLLQEMPASFHADHKVLQDSGGKPIGMETEPIRFAYDRCEKWNHSSIVALLKPANERSEVALRGLEMKREELNRRFEERFGIVSASKKYRPHVSLGYLANKTIGEQAEDAVLRLNGKLADGMAGTTIRFPGISLYGMTDMETFFRWKKD